MASNLLYRSHHALHISPVDNIWHSWNGLVLASIVRISTDRIRNRIRDPYGVQRVLPESVGSCRVRDSLLRAGEYLPDVYFADIVECGNDRLWTSTKVSVPSYHRGGGCRLASPLDVRDPDCVSNVLGQRSSERRLAGR